MLQSNAPLVFLGRFLLVSTIISLAWEPLAGYYLATLLPAVNALLDIGVLAIHLERDAQWMKLVVQSPDGSVQSLRFSGYQMLHLHAVAGVALFAATPVLSRPSKARWIAGLLLLFWLSQVWTLHEGTLRALAEYWQQLPTDRQQTLRQSGWPADFFAPTEGGLYAWWNMWGGAALVLALWMVAVERYLLPGDD